jgi:GYD domain.
MARYISLIQFTDQGIRNIKDTIKRTEAAMPRPKKWA